MQKPARRFTLAGGTLLALLACCAAIAPAIAPWAPDRQDLAHRLEGPTASHPLGRDDLGRDVLSRLLWGARVSLLVGLSVVTLSAAIGITLGTAAGFAGGRLDLGLMILVDVLLGFPGVLLAIALVAILGPGLGHMILALTIIGWVVFARLARSQAIRMKSMNFVESALATGCGPARTALRHLLPNVLGPIAVQAALGLGGVILAEAGLSFLGLGVAPPRASWGEMLRSGTQNLLDAPHLTIAPGCAIFAAVLGANLLGEGLTASRRPLTGEPGPEPVHRRA